LLVYPPASAIRFACIGLAGAIVASHPASAQNASAPILIAQAPSADLEYLWRHNASIMRLERSGDRVRIIYHEVAARLSPTIEEGMTLFEGRVSDGSIVGEAVVFKRGCTPAPYRVRGQIADIRRTGQLTLAGPSPRRASGGCGVLGLNADSPNARLVFSPLGGVRGLATAFPESGGADTAAALAPAAASPASVAERSAAPVDGTLLRAEATSEILTPDIANAEALKEGARLSYELFRRAVKARPEILDSRLQGALSAFGGFRTTPDLSHRYGALKTRFSSSNEFEREAAAREARALFLEDATDDALVFDLRVDIMLAPYSVNAGGFPLLSTSLGRPDASLELGARRGVTMDENHNLEVDLAPWTIPTVLPMTREGAEAIVRQMGSNRRVSVVRRIAVMRGGVSAVGDQPPAAKGRVLFARVHSQPPSGDRDGLGPVLGELPLTTPPAWQSARSAVVAALDGLALVEGAPALLIGEGPGTVDGTSRYEALRRLTLLLALKANNELLLEPNLAELYAPLVGRPAERFAEIVRYSPTHVETKWRGANEIERSEARSAFVATFGPELLRAAPDFPIEISVLRGLVLPQYDVNGRVFIFADRGSPNQSILTGVGNVSFLAPNPIEMPERWEVDSDRARAMLTQLGSIGGVSGQNRLITIVNRVRIDGARRQQNGRFILDLTPANTSFAVYGGRPELVLSGRGVLLGQITPPPDGFPSAVPAPDATLRFDAELPRLIAAQFGSGLVTTPQFAAESARIRLAKERSITQRRPGAVTDWPRHFPATTLRAEQDLNPEQLQRFANWSRARTQQGVSAFQINTVVGRRQDDMFGFDLARSLREALGAESDFAESNAPSATVNLARASIRDVFPDSYDSMVLPAGRGLIAVAALRNNDAWVSVDVPRAKLNPGVPPRGSIEFSIVERRLWRSPEGLPVLHLLIEPRRLLVELVGLPRVDIAIPSTPRAVAGQQPAGPASKHEVLGIRLGMPIEEAVRIAQAALPGAKQEPMPRGVRYSRSSGPDCARARASNDAAAITRECQRYASSRSFVVQREGNINDSLDIYHTEVAGVGDVVVMVERTLDVSSSGTPPQILDFVEAELVDRLGPPTVPDPGRGQNRRTAWFSDHSRLEMRQFLENLDRDNCHFVREAHGRLSFYSSFPACGSILLVTRYATTAHVHLVDTGFVRRRGAEIEREISARAQAASTRVAPAIAAPAPASATNAAASPRLDSDVVGVTPGMTLDEAERIIQAHMPDARRLRLRNTGPGGQIVAFGHGTLYIREDGREIVVLITHPVVDPLRVLGVGRYLAEDYDAAGLAARLIEKYSLIDSSDRAMTPVAMSRARLKGAEATNSSCEIKIGPAAGLSLLDLQGQAAAAELKLPITVRAEGAVQLQQLGWPGVSHAPASNPTLMAPCAHSVTAWMPTRTGVGQVLIVWSADLAGYARVVGQGTPAAQGDGPRPGIPRL